MEAQRQAKCMRPMEVDRTKDGGTMRALILWLMDRYGGTTE